MKAAIAALIAGAAASAHNGHVGFHARRGGEVFEKRGGDVCTVYTTVYVYPSDIPAPVVNSTVYVYPSPVPETTTSAVVLPPSSSSVSSTEAPYTPYSSSSEVVYVPSSSSTEAPYVPSSSSSSSSEVVYTPYTPSSEAVYTPTKEAYTPPPVETPVYSAPAYTPAAKPSTHAAPKPKPSKPASSSYSAGGRIVTKGKKWAITYTPYTKEGECKEAEEVKGDIAKIAEMGFTTIRSYSTDCGVFENVVPACTAHGLKVIYGLFLEAGGAGGKGPFSTYANEQLEEIKSKAPKDSVAMIIVGNEALFNKYCTAEELGSYIDYVRKTLQGAGFPSDIAITTTEPVDVWQQYGAPLCSHIDVFTVQVHPYFTAKVYASMAGEFAKEQLELAASVCPEAASKGKYISEIGWPHGGNPNGNAIPGYSEQKTAIASILDTVGTEACLFSYQDDMWKAPGAYDVEQNFGCGDAL